MVTKSAVIGIDLGSAESYVGYVGKGIVDICQNEVSKRATPSLVGFTDRERLLGDAALAQIKSNAKNTCRNFKHILGRKIEAPDLEKESFWSTSKLVTTEDGLAGYEVNYKGETRQFSAIQCCAMYLTKLKEITESWCQAKVADVVISVPSYFSDVQRQAVLDSASIAGLSVLRIMNEHTATALAYGIYRSNDFDPEKPMTVAFCSMGSALFSVSIVQFVRGKLNVLCERSELVGGRDMDECLMREFAAQFQKKHGCDPLSNKKAAFKLEDAIAKTKKILSANSEAGISVECLMEDEDFASNITRADFEKMCEPAMAKAQAVLDKVIAESPVPVDQIDSVEIVGGASRVPWVKQIISAAFGGKDLSTTMNQEESVARGCALQAAIQSPLYKVREFAIQDSSNFAINVGWMGSAADAAAVKEDDGDTQMAGGEGEYKTATVFPTHSAMNVLKMLTFYRTNAFDIKAEYADDTALLPLTPKELGTFHVEVPPQTEAKKVKVKAKLNGHAMFSIESAQLIEEEEYEETVKEKREIEVPAEEAAEGEAAKEGEGEGEAKEGEGEKKEEKKEEKKLLGGMEAEGYRVVRPTGPEEPRFFNFLLPTKDPVLRGKEWGEMGDLDDKKALSATYKGLLGPKDEAKSLVLAGKLPTDFLKSIRDYKYPEGTGIISDSTPSKQFVDLEWTDMDVLNGKDYKVHNFARVYYSGVSPDKDVLLLFQVPDTQAEMLRGLWPQMRDTMALGV
mmetsp:Transcript_90733/g.282646  ORF Transcript_90733/g.282646 Transcript_90733/m.282646 type:complete len:738 (-) Transcript_90733:100-2313(-)